MKDNFFTGFDPFSFYFGQKIKRIPICNKCEHQKKGLTTICECYKRIPSNVQEGGYCEKFTEIKG